VSGDRGSSLMLMPAAVLVMMLLGAIALDAAAIRMQSRELRNVARSAANDALSAAVDVDHLRETGEIRIDESLARVTVDEAITRRSVADAAVDAVVVTTEPDGTIVLTVTLRRSVDHVLRPPGTDPSVTLTAVGSARQYIE
jgi:hypothetical protein